MKYLWALLALTVAAKCSPTIAIDTTPADIEGPFELNSMDVVPDDTFRQQFPDRLWYADHPQGPAATSNETVWGLSNDRGNTPAYWTEIDKSALTRSTSASLTKRLPSYIAFYRNRGCSNEVARCSYPSSGTCCTNNTGRISVSIRIPSSVPGDIISIFDVHDCDARIGNVLSPGFTGCYNGASYLFSVFAFSCTSRC